MRIKTQKISSDVCGRTRLQLRHIWNRKYRQRKLLKEVLSFSQWLIKLRKEEISEDRRPYWRSC